MRGKGVITKIRNLATENLVKNNSLKRRDPKEKGCGNCKAKCLKEYCICFK